MTQGHTSDREQLLRTLESSGLSVHFQPIVDLHDGVIVAYEALTRIDPASGFSNTSELFETAAAEGLLWDLEARTRRNAIQAAANWPAHTRLFINCTPAVFADGRFASQLATDLLATPELRPERLVLEITELSDDQHVPGLVEQVRAVTAAGFHVALDDAGAGASGLNRMMMLRPQWVKLDREFVRGIDSDLLRQNLVRFFVHFARLSGVGVVAEGIESATELQTVAALGVRFAQGYYLGRPGSREQTLDPTFVTDVRARWSAVEASIPQESFEPTLGAICRNVGVCPIQTTVDAASTLAARFPDMPGVLVTDGSRLVGWMPQGVLASRAADSTLADCCDSLIPVAPLRWEMTAHEAVAALCTRDDDRMPDPVVVTSGEQIHGVVRLRDLLRFAATGGQLAGTGRTQLTGLPSRQRADEHLSRIIRDVPSGDRGEREVQPDVAFVDVRDFADFNNRHGPAKGDALLTDLAEMISAIVVSAVQDVFVAHLGDDRFLLTSDQGRLLPALHRLTVAFDARQDDVPQRHPSLRILYLPDVCRWARHPRDVHRAEQRLREQMRARDVTPDSTGSYVFVHEEPDGRRLAA